MVKKSYKPLGIAYIVPSYSGDTAISENVRRRKKTLEELGFTIYIIEHQEGKITRTCMRLWGLRKSVVAIIIRLDGTSLLDKYTLLKLILPLHKFIWEIHGFPEERLEFSLGALTRWAAWKNSVKRRALSLLINASIFVSPDLLTYSQKKIFTRHACVIPNFTHAINQPLQSAHRFLLPRLLKKQAFVVLWGGDASLPWQATDLIQHVAKETKKYDRNILFLLVGTHHYYQHHASDNIVYLRSMPYTQFIDVVTQSDVCLALYHHPKHIPFYFYPMKLIDYLSAGKPVISTNIGSVSTLIHHGVNGYLTDNSIQDISRTIRRLKQNRSLSKKIGRSAQVHAADYFSQVRARSMYDKLFQSLFAR